MAKKTTTTSLTFATPNEVIKWVGEYTSELTEDIYSLQTIVDGYAERLGSVNAEIDLSDSNSSLLSDTTAFPFVLEESDHVTLRMVYSRYQLDMDVVPTIDCVLKMLGKLLAIHATLYEALEHDED